MKSKISPYATGNLFHRNVLGLLGGNNKPLSQSVPSVRYFIKIRSKGLWFGPYTEYQKSLSDKVIMLRELQGLTFSSVAYQLIAEGYSSPRGMKLSAESVFSIYKKRLIRDRRLEATPSLDVRFLNVDMN